MDIKEFVSVAIMQIAQGIKEASEKCQENQLDVIVNPNVTIGSDNGAGIPKNPEQYQISRRIQMVDMDIAVTVQNTKERGTNGSLSISVLGIGGKRIGKSANIHESRIHFSIPVSFPVTIVPKQESQDKFSEIDY